MAPILLLLEYLGDLRLACLTSLARHTLLQTLFWVHVLASRFLSRVPHTDCLKHVIFFFRFPFHFLSLFPFYPFPLLPHYISFFPINYFFLSLFLHLFLHCISFPFPAFLFLCLFLFFTFLFCLLLSFSYFSFSSLFPSLVLCLQR